MLGDATKPREGALGTCKGCLVRLRIRCIELKCPFSGHDCEITIGELENESLFSAVTLSIDDVSDIL